jgi:hypothetical protein
MLNALMETLTVINSTCKAVWHVFTDFPLFTY